MTVTILKPGLQSSLQARPRSGMRHLGVPAGGAADPLSLALANTLVGNAWDAPAIEATLLGPTVRFESKLVFALAGATAAPRLNNEEVPLHATTSAQAGDVLEVGPVTAGARVYLAVAGGMDAHNVLGSSSTNLQAAFGGHEGRALRADDRIVAPGGDAEPCATPDAFRPPMTTSWGLRTCVGPEGELVADMDVLFDTNWVVDRRADRMGLRLDGPRLSVLSDGRMPSAGVMPGTVQCPEDGVPYLLSVDAGTVGGDPRMPQVTRGDRHVLAQLRRGDHVRVLDREPEEAVAELRATTDYWREWLPDIETII